VAAGAIAQEFLRQQSISCQAYTTRIGGIDAEIKNPEKALEQPFFSPDPDIISNWEERIKEVRSQGDTLGGVVEVCIKNVPAGLGEPVFDKIDARLAYALMSIGAVKGIEIGSGCQSADSLGSQNNDFLDETGFLSNNAGGILGGISSGQDIIVRAYVKPIPSISKPQQTVDNKSQATEITIGGRHDICAIPRIVPVLKSMAMLTVADFILLQRRMN